MSCIGSIASYDNLEKVGEGTYGYVFKARDKRDGAIVALKRLILHKPTSGFPLCAIREIKFLKSLKHKNIVNLRDIASSKGAEHLGMVIMQKFEHMIYNLFVLSPLAIFCVIHFHPLLSIALLTSSTFTTTKDVVVEKKAGEAENDPLGCGSLYLVFDYVEHDLAGLIDVKYEFPAKAIKYIAKQLFEALLFLHDKRIIHRVYYIDIIFCSYTQRGVHLHLVSTDFFSLFLL